MRSAPSHDAAGAPRGTVVTVLALDTATAACSAAIWRDGVVLAGESAAMQRGHAEALMPMAARVAAAACLRMADVDVFAVTVGPGAFTGLRVGLAAARGLALAAGRPCIGVTTLEALAAAVPVEERRGRTVLAALDSKRDDLFVQAFDSAGLPLTEAAVAPVDALDAVLPAGPVTIAGDAAEVAAEALVRAGRDVRLSTAPPHPDAAAVAELAASRAGAVAGPPQPVYLRPPEAKVPRAGGRRRP